MHALVILRSEERPDLSPESLFVSAQASDHKLLRAARMQIVMTESGFDSYPHVMKEYCAVLHF